MAKVSVIIPSRNEKYLVKTVKDIFAKAKAEIEVIVVVDGPTEYPLPSPRRNLKLIYKSEPEGIRSSINTGANAATGKYLLKVDAHCALPPGFDKAFQKDYEDNWVVVPRVYLLDVDRWKRSYGRKPIDYAYFSCPWKNLKDPRLFMMRDCRWYPKDETRKNVLIDDLMTFIGCCWFTSYAHFRNIGGLNPNDFGDYAENQEISLKTWLGGGRMVLNKKIWCAHSEQQSTGRGYSLPKSAIIRSQVAIAKYFANNQWPDQVHDFAWLIEKFWPLPTKKEQTRTGIDYWPEDWKDYYTKTKTKEGVKLDQLALKYGSDKCPQIGHFYTDYYTKLFTGKREKIKKVLEIGVGSPGGMPHSPNYQTGASLSMWQDYFPKAKIYSIDVLPDLVFKKNRIETYLCDQTDKAGLMRLIKKIGSDIDLVVDDGSHMPEDQVFTCLTLMSLLKDDVVYIIEDVRDKSIAKYFKGYTVEIVRKSRMFTFDDRLIKVVNKTE